MDPVPHFPSASSRKKIKSITSRPQQQQQQPPPVYDKRLLSTDYIEFLSSIVPTHHVRRIDGSNQGVSQNRQNHFASSSVKSQELIDSFRPNRLGEMHPSSGSLILGSTVSRRVAGHRSRSAPREILPAGMSELIDRGLTGGSATFGEALFNPRSPEVEYNFEGQQEQLMFQMARIAEVNQQLEGLIQCKDKAFLDSMNLAVNTARPSNETSVPGVVAHRLKKQNDDLFKDLDQKSKRISQLENEKAVLIRELFDARAHAANPLHGPWINNNNNNKTASDNKTFM